MLEPGGLGFRVWGLGLGGLGFSVLTGLALLGFRLRFLKFATLRHGPLGASTSGLCTQL